MTNMEESYRRLAESRLKEAEGMLKANVHLCREVDTMRGQLTSAHNIIVVLREEIERQRKQLDDALNLINSLRRDREVLRYSLGNK